MVELDYRSGRQKADTMTGFTYADVVMSGSTIAGSLIHTAAYAMLCRAFIKKEKLKKTQIVLILLLSAAAAISVLSIRGSFGALRCIAVLYCIASIVLLFSSFNLSGRILAGSVLLFISGLLVFNNQIRGEAFIRHFISLGVYYIAITILASANIKNRRYNN